MTTAVKSSNKNPIETPAIDELENVEETAVASVSEEETTAIALRGEIESALTEVMDAQIPPEPYTQYGFIKKTAPIPPPQQPGKKNNAPIDPSTLRGSFELYVYRDNDAGDEVPTRTTPEEITAIVLEEIENRDLWMNTENNIPGYGKPLCKGAQSITLRNALPKDDPRRLITGYYQHHDLTSVDSNHPDFKKIKFDTLRMGGVPCSLCPHGQWDSEKKCQVRRTFVILLVDENGVPTEGLEPYVISLPPSSITSVTAMKRTLNAANADARRSTLRSIGRNKAAAGTADSDISSSLFGNILKFTVVGGKSPKATSIFAKVNIEVVSKIPEPVQKLYEDFRNWAVNGLFYIPSGRRNDLEAQMLIQEEKAMDAAILASKENETETEEGESTEVTNETTVDVASDEVPF
jgi:hypothetical protein